MPIPCGDVDCSLTVDARDAMGIIRYLAFVPPTAACIGNGYVTCDDVFDLLDALAILRYAGGIPPACHNIR